MTLYYILYSRVVPTCQSLFFFILFYVIAINTENIIKAKTNKYLKISVFHFKYRYFAKLFEYLTYVNSILRGCHRTICFLSLAHAQHIDKTHQRTIPFSMFLI